jgi:hypothetical protein
MEALQDIDQEHISCLDEFVAKLQTFHMEFDAYSVMNLNFTSLFFPGYLVYMGLIFFSLSCAAIRKTPSELCSRVWKFDRSVRGSSGS